MISWSDVKLIPKKKKKPMKGGSWINMRILASHEGRILVHYEVKHHPCLSLKSGASQKMISLVIHIICYSLCLILCVQNILEKYQVFPCQIVL